MKRWSLFLVSVVTVFGTPALVRDTESAGRQPFDTRPLDELRAQPPDYVFFGDSMLYTRIAPARLSALLGGRRVRLFATGGSGSALWYLQLRNYVVASGSHPERVFIFFRDRDLTEPT